MNTDISRGKNNAISQLAFKENVSTREIDRKRVFELINSQRNTHEIAEIMGKEIHQISGRFTELKKEGKITSIGFYSTKEKEGLFTLKMNFSDVRTQRREIQYHARTKPKRQRFNLSILNKP